jgi:hypothetical protein
VRLQLRVINHLSVAYFCVPACVQSNCRNIGNQRRCVAKIVGFGSHDLKLDWYVVLHQNESYPYLTEDRTPYSHQDEGGSLDKQVSIAPCRLFIA